MGKAKFGPNGLPGQYFIMVNHLRRNTHPIKCTCRLSTRGTCIYSSHSPFLNEAWKLHFIDYKDKHFIGEQSRGIPFGYYFSLFPSIVAKQIQVIPFISKLVDFTHLGDL